MSKRLRFFCECSVETRVLSSEGRINSWAGILFAPGDWLVPDSDEHGADSWQGFGELEAAGTPPDLANGFGWCKGLHQRGPIFVCSFKFIHTFATFVCVLHLLMHLLWVYIVLKPCASLGPFVCPFLQVKTGLSRLEDIQLAVDGFDSTSDNELKKFLHGLAAKVRTLNSFAVQLKAAKAAAEKEAKPLSKT